MMSGGLFGSLLVSSLVPHHERIGLPAETVVALGVNFWTQGCQQKYSVYFSSSTITPSHVSPGEVFLNSSQSFR